MVVKVLVRDDMSFTFTRKNKRLKVACVMDEFTYKCFEPECELLQITPENWKLEMDGFEPDMLFLESAWQGKDGKWGGRLITAYNEIGEIAIYCSLKAIPVVFWNKEDPFGYETFLPVAKIADAVFTTAAECVEKYKKDLGHTNVQFMHFAAQPKLHNAEEEYTRQDKFCFAGAYYRQFPERIKVFDVIYDCLEKYRGVDIYDRFYNDKKRAFPKKYSHSVKGTLAYNEISKAYKGYKYNININSITDSDSMFARRVFELMASNTVVVGNYSRGLKNYFGDLTICSDDPKEITERLEEINKSPRSYEEFRQKALSRILEKELYSHRLEQVCSLVFEG